MNTDTRHSNRRTSERERVAFTAVVWPATEDVESRSSMHMAHGFKVAFIGNLSMSGLSFQSPIAYPLGTELWIRIRMGSNTCQFKGVVQRATTGTTSGHRTYISGIEFVSSHQTTHAQAIVAGYFETVRRKTRTP